MLILSAFLIGVVAGLRTVTAPAAVSWGAFLGWLPVAETWAAFMGMRVSVAVFSLMALGEFVADKLPVTPSRRTPPQFGARIVSGGFCGAVVGLAAGGTALGAVAGVLGAVAGTLGGAAARTRLSRAFGRDLPAALIEDAVAVALGLGVVATLG